MVNGKLAIVGSSRLTLSQAETALWIVECILRSETPRLVISGGALGVDTIVANAVYASKAYSLKEFLPDIPQWNSDGGRKGYKARNILIAEECDELVAIRSRTAGTYGSGWTADYAEILGKPVRRLYV